MALIDFLPRSTTLAGASRPRLSLTVMLDVWRSRRALKSLDQDALADVGLDAKMAHKEAQKPIWDVPDNWRR